MRTPYIEGGYKKHHRTAVFAEKLGVDLAEAARIIVDLYCTLATATRGDVIQGIDHHELAATVRAPGKPIDLVLAMLYSELVHIKPRGSLERLTDWHYFVNSAPVVRIH